MIAQLMQLNYTLARERSLTSLAQQRRQGLPVVSARSSGHRPAAGCQTATADA